MKNSALKDKMSKDETLHDNKWQGNTLDDNGGKHKKVAVIGGGPAGLAAAWSAALCGCDTVLIERSPYLGGVLPQCIHTGFGTQIYGEDLTGGEYSAIWIRKAAESGAELLTGTTVMSIACESAAKSEETPESKEASGCREKYGAEEPAGGKWNVRCVSAASGDITISADAVIAATGCRERTLPQIGIPGSRPAGIFTAGSAQLMMNIKNYLPGRSAVIFGSGDIGLIMARRMTLEGIRVKTILGEKSTGLARNIVQCVEDFDIPIRYGWTLASTHGYDRLKGVSVREIKTGRKEYIPCDTLLVAAGLVPETELFSECIGKPDFYICGNASRVHDLVDHVTAEAAAAGAEASGRTGGLPEEIRRLLALEIREQSSGGSGNMICTVCPKSCVMQAVSRPFSVSGNECVRGEKFARQELENPQRVVTAVVKTVDENGSTGIVSVRTAAPVEKSRIPEVMRAARKAAVRAPVHQGQKIEAAGTVFVVTGAAARG